MATTAKAAPPVSLFFGNDGYGATGGAFLLVSGMILGWVYAKRKPLETPHKIKKQSQANFNELIEFAKSKEKNK